MSEQSGTLLPPSDHLIRTFLCTWMLTVLALDVRRAAAVWRCLWSVSTRSLLGTIDLFDWSEAWTTCLPYTYLPDEFENCTNQIQNSSRSDMSRLSLLAD